MANMQKVQKQNDRYWRKRDRKMAAQARFERQQSGPVISRRHSSAFAVAAGAMLIASPAMAASTVVTDTTGGPVVGLPSTPGAVADTDNGVGITYSSVTPGTQHDLNLGGAAKAIVNWGSFDVTNGKTLSINNGAAAGFTLLNKVTGAGASTLGGLVTSAGNNNIILVNPNGITVQSTAQFD
ncbi:MAG: filamentous hemagglutinin N-terminal domain-containing protein, partial [Mariprofundus sp.]